VRCNLLERRWNLPSDGQCSTSIKLATTVLRPAQRGQHLTDRELDLLIAAAMDEAKRRGRVPPSVRANASDETIPKRSPSKDKRQAESATVSLTRGQVNAVRAAFKAGITPSRIARQFGISQSDVRKALASDTATQKVT
jgi:DNA-binding CsgD family transcriptional regulator